MFRRVFDRRAARIVALLATVSYLSVGLLGYGLHSVLKCEHTSASNRDCCCHGDCASHVAHAYHSESAPHGAAITATCDDCSICSLLAQAQCAAVPAIALDGCKPLMATAQLAEPQIHPVLGDAPHARGPPTG